MSGAGYAQEADCNARGEKWMSIQIEILNAKSQKWCLRTNNIEYQCQLDNGGRNNIGHCCGKRNAMNSYKEISDVDNKVQHNEIKIAATKWKVTKYICVICTDVGN